MDSLYERKLLEMSTYVPFLQKLIKKLEDCPTDPSSKFAQLTKLRSLLNILTDTKKKLHLDILRKCEDVLHKLYERVEGCEKIRPSSSWTSISPSLNSPRNNYPSRVSYPNNQWQNFQNVPFNRGRFEFRSPNSSFSNRPPSLPYRGPRGNNFDPRFGSRYRFPPRVPSFSRPPYLSQTHHLESPSSPYIESPSSPIIEDSPASPLNVFDTDGCEPKLIPLERNVELESSENKGSLPPWEERSTPLLRHSLTPPPPPSLHSLSSLPETSIPLRPTSLDCSRKPLTYGEYRKLRQEAEIHRNKENDSGTLSISSSSEPYRIPKKTNDKKVLRVKVLCEEPESILIKSPPRSILPSSASNFFESDDLSDSDSELLQIDEGSEEEVEKEEEKEKDKEESSKSKKSKKVLSSNDALKNVGGSLDSSDAETRLSRSDKPQSQEKRSAKELKYIVEDAEDEPLRKKPKKTESNSNVPKSKTWFPIRSNVKKKEEKKSIVSVHPEVKIEKRPADINVFLGSEILNNIPNFIIQSPSPPSLVFDYIKNRNHQLVNKILSNYSSETKKKKTKIVTTSVSVKIKSKNQCFEFDSIEPANHLYIDNVTATIQKLTTTLPYGIISPDRDSLSSCSSDSEDLLLTHIKNIIHRDDNGSFDTDPQLVTNIRTSQILSAKFKDLKSLFKCICGFTTDYLKDFKIHLNEKCGSALECVYCSKKCESSTLYIEHIIEFHGKCPYQCIYCVFRTSSKMNLYIHLQNLHPERKKSFYLVKHLPKEEMIDKKRLSSIVFKCQQKNCNYSSSNKKLMASHCQNTHSLCKSEWIEYQCKNCEFTNKVLTNVLLHQSIGCCTGIVVHRVENRKLEISQYLMDLYGDDIETENTLGEEKGLCGSLLYRCGNTSCVFTANSANEFKVHTCESSDNTCFHCQKRLKHRVTLLEHLKSHGLKRHYCTLCPFKCALIITMKNHLKSTHKASQTKPLPLDPSRTNMEVDYFLHLPKNSIPKNFGNKKRKDLFSPLEINDIPSISMFRHIIRCASCDFTTKVRQNMVKHLNLHLKKEQIPVITPINPPSNEDSQNFKKMGIENTPFILLDAEYESMPVRIAEKSRFKCCYPDCNYITVDSTMLLHHISALHIDLEIYKCPHCSSSEIPFEEIEFHLRCHGDLLFKCHYCSYYHWQKRTAESHVSENHPRDKLHVHDIRAIGETKKNKEIETSHVILPSLSLYRCGICDFTTESESGIKEHVKSVHELTGKYKCAHCQRTEDRCDEIEKHHEKKHSENESLIILRVYFIEQAVPLEYEKRLPLWQRNMPGIRNIRGITYEEENTENLEHKKPWTNEFSETFILKCSECGLVKRTIKGLKMHIKMIHLRVGKYRCNQCQYSANILTSIQVHCKNTHPDFPSSDYEIQNGGDSKVFSKDYWERNWGISSELIEPPNKSKRGVGGAKSKKKKELDKKVDSSLIELSPFEHVPTFKCLYCSKRSQNLLRMEQHLESEHDQVSGGHKLLSRDEVVDLITLNNGTGSSSSSGGGDYNCFYCDVVSGSISDLQEHFAQKHTETLKVKKSKSPISSYLECSLCGYLTGGFDRSSQRFHYREEHPEEDNIQFHKYILKSKSNECSKKSSLSDLTRFNGQSMKCSADCDFETKSLSAMTSHLRKHTQTFKCGHCGQTYSNSSEFHCHSAMDHGDKIPDLVKDPQAEAEFEALRGLLEASLLKRDVNKKKNNVAKKSVSRKRQPQIGYSFYGRSPEKFDMTMISTEMSMGGMKIPIKVKKMASLVNLNPILQLEDIYKVV